MAEFHPAYDLIAGYSYFHKAQPDIETEQSYSENDESAGQQVVVWSHSIGEVCSALIRAGLQLQGLQEYAHSPYDCFEGLQERESGKFYLQHQGQDVPLVYSVQATKPL
jgi:hypothetical protein